MKIMFLASSYFPAQDGVSQVTQYLAEGLAKKHEVFVIATRKDYGETEERNGVRIERIRARRNRFTCRCQGERKRVRDSIFRYQPDVLIIVGVQVWGYDWFKRKLDQLSGKKVLMTHGCSCLGEYHVWEQVRQVRFRRQIVADLLRVNNEWYWKKYQKTLAKDMARFHLVSYLFEGEDLYGYSKRAGLQNAMILENATEDFFFERKAYVVDEKKEIVFINVSTYEERKNQKMILQAYHKANLPNTRLVLIGSKETEYYRELAGMKEKIEGDSEWKGCVDIYAGLTRGQVLELYKSADIYVSASSWEAMSISICEAAAAGLLILSTNVGHVAQIPGVLFFDSVEELRELMERAYREPDVRRENGMCAYAYAEENYRTQKKVDQLESALIGLVGE